MLTDRTSVIAAANEIGFATAFPLGSAWCWLEITPEKRAIAAFGKPGVIRLDNGPDFTSSLFDSWAYRRRVRLDFIAPGKPTQNGMIESFNRKFRDEVRRRR